MNPIHVIEHLSFALLPLILFSFHDPSKSDQKGKLSDKELVAKVKAVAGVVPQPTPENVESLVGIPSCINTIREGNQLDPARVDFDKDEEEKMKVPPLFKMKHVVYWIRPLKTPPTRIVGICWDNDGKPSFFFAVAVLP